MAVIIKKNEFSANQECYTPKEPILEMIDTWKRLYSKEAIIWCPFDTKDSNFVIELQKHFKVVYSHVNDGKDFFSYQPEKWDIIISNPPFQNKRLLLERVLSFNKPFWLLYGCSIFNNNGMANVLNRCGFTFIYKPIKFINGKKFLCCWVSNI